MRRVVVCPTDFLFRLFQGTSGNSDSWVFLVSDGKTRTGLARQDASALAGALDDPGLYRRAHLSLGGPRDADGPGATPARPEPGADPGDDPRGGAGGARPGRPPGRPATVPAAPPEREHGDARAHDARGPAPRDGPRAPPRPHRADAARSSPGRTASASSSRTIPIRTRWPRASRSAPCSAAPGRRPRSCRSAASRGRRTSPWWKRSRSRSTRSPPRGSARYDALAMVDVQPAFCEEALPQIAVVIDHHPEAKGWRAPFRDVRPTYGATSTIMTEYLRAAEVKITERVATALFYGIKTDTLHLERGGTRADMEAFAYLYGLANHNILRRIERPELPLDALDALGDALVHRTIIQNALFAHLGRVSRPDLIPQFADLCLQVKGIEWSVVSGPDGRRGPHLGPQRRLRPRGRGRRADRLRRARLGGRPPFGREGGDPREHLGRPRRAARGRRDAPRDRQPLRPRSRRQRHRAAKSARRLPPSRSSGDMLAGRRDRGASDGLGGSGRRARLTVRGPRAEDDERDNAPQAGGSPRVRGPGADPSRDAGARVLVVRAWRPGRRARAAPRWSAPWPIRSRTSRSTAPPDSTCRGANTLPGGELSIGLGYLGQQAVCQQEEGIFDQNTLFLALGYGITERIQLSLQVPYTWYEADKSDFDGQRRRRSELRSRAIASSTRAGGGRRSRWSDTRWRRRPSARKASARTSGAAASRSPPPRRSRGRSAPSQARAISTTAAAAPTSRISSSRGSGSSTSSRRTSRSLAEGTANTNWRTGRGPTLRLDRRDERGRAPAVRRLPDQPGRPEGLHQRRAGLGRLRPRHLPDERRDAVRREGGGRTGARAAPGPERARAPVVRRERAGQVPGAAHPARVVLARCARCRWRAGSGRARCTGRGAPGAGGPGAGGPAQVRPVPVAPRAPVAPGCRRTGREGGRSGSGRGRACRPRRYRRRSARRSGTSTSSSTSTPSPTRRRRPSTSWPRRSRRTRSSPSRSKGTPTSAGPSSTTSRSASSGPRPPRPTWSPSAWTRAASTPSPTVSSSRVDAGHDELAWAINRRAHFVVRRR